MEYGHFKRRGGGDFNRSSGDNRDRGGFNRDRSDNRDRGDFNRDRGGFRDQGGFRDRSDRSGGFRDRGGDFDRDNEESVFSKRVRAGKRRTYFLDVRKTRGEDFFITITESTRREDGFGYKRHKIFLYKEDFNRFVASLNEVVEHVKTNLMPDFDYEEFDRRQAEWEAQNREADDMDRADDPGDADDDPAKDDDAPASEQPPVLKPGKKSAPKEEDDMDW
ncbi:MAG: DUF3276 family protein [Saprospiraceae bacterium]